MQTVSVVGQSLVVTLTGWDRFWALKQRIEVPLDRIERVIFDPAISRRPEGLRAPGSYWPGRIMAGTYRKRGMKSFWSVRDHNKAIVIDLKEGAPYRRLVLQVPDPMTAIAMIEEAATSLKAQGSRSTF